VSSELVGACFPSLSWAYQSSSDHTAEAALTGMATDPEPF
jgi:hypothetical protein